MKKSSTRNKIIKAARSLFSEKGFKGATTAEIAKTAEISEGTIYRHFSSKTELLMECVTPVLKEIIDNLDDNISAKDNLRDFTIYSIEMRLNLYEKHYETMRIVLNELPYSREMAALFVAFLKEQEEKISRYLEKVEDLNKIKRFRNYWLFGVGHVMSLWYFINFKKWGKEGVLDFEHVLLNTSEENIASDLADYFLYGISGIPEKED